MLSITREEAWRKFNALKQQKKQVVAILAQDMIEAETQRTGKAPKTIGVW